MFAAVPFEEFYEREFDGQARRAYLLLGDVDAAFDVVQSAFVAVFRRYERVTDPGAYLNTAVLNGCRDWARRGKVRSVHRHLVAAAPEASAVEFLSDVLAGLPFNQRAAVVLKFYAGWTEAEIADWLGCPAGSIGPWVRRALQAMEKELA